MLPSIIVGIIVVAILAFAIYQLIGNKKKGRSSCGCGCSACKTACSSKDAKKEEKK